HTVRRRRVRLRVWRGWGTRCRGRRSWSPTRRRRRERRQAEYAVGQLPQPTRLPPSQLGVPHAQPDGCAPYTEHPDLRGSNPVPEQKPSVGRIVHYRLTQLDVDVINRLRADAMKHLPAHQEHADGTQIHVGNSVAAGDVYPLVITRVWNEHGVNGQVLLDGNDTYWATSRVEGDEPGQWQWPPRV